MEIMKRNIPLDFEGLVHRFLFPSRQLVWVIPWSLDEIQRKQLVDENSKELRFSLSLTQQKRLEKLRRQVRCGTGNWKSKLPEVAIRHGKSQLAMAWMNGYILRSAWNPGERLEARARLLLSHDRAMVKRLLIQSRQWPKDTWQLHDVSATYIPQFIIQLRRQVTSAEVQIISGSHLLAEGNWRWQVTKGSLHPCSVQYVD